MSPLKTIALQILGEQDELERQKARWRRLIHKDFAYLLACERDGKEPVRVTKEVREAWENWKKS